MAEHQRIVFICSRCGAGFLRYPGQYHPEPVWMLLDGTQGEDCFGEVIKADPEELARKLTETAK